MSLHAASPTHFFCDFLGPAVWWLGHPGIQEFWTFAWTYWSIYVKYYHLTLNLIRIKLIRLRLFWRNIDLFSSRGTAFDSRKGFPIVAIWLVINTAETDRAQTYEFFIKKIILTINFINHNIITFRAGNFNAISIVDPTALFIIWDEFWMTAFSLMTQFVALTSRTELNFYLYHVFSNPFNAQVQLYCFF